MVIITSHREPYSINKINMVMKIHGKISPAFNFMRRKKKKKKPNEISQTEEVKMIKKREDENDKKRPHCGMRDPTFTCSMFFTPKESFAIH